MIPKPDHDRAAEVAAVIRVIDEDDADAVVQATGTQSAFAAYLRAWPDGRYVDRVEAIDDAAFAAAKAGGRISDYVAYRSNWPKGQYAPISEAEFFQQACDGGSTAGCDNLGLMYDLGRGVPEDDARAAVF